MSQIPALAFVVLAASAPLVTSVTHLKFGMYVDYPPYAFRNVTTSELTGFGKDVADGMSALCDDVSIEVVETRWAECGHAADTPGGWVLGPGLENGSLDACMTYTHTQGVRTEFAEFSHGIVRNNKAAGLLVLLENGQPKVDGRDDLSGKRVVDVAGWAPTPDGLNYVENKCTAMRYSTNYTLLIGSSPDEALKMVLAGDADAMLVYADQAYQYSCARKGAEVSWDCTLWDGLGSKFAYVQTGQLGYTVNGTTIAMAKKGSGVAAKVNSCVARFLQTREYYDACVKYELTESCYRNEFFPAGEEDVPIYSKLTNQQEGDCSDGYCPCPGEQPTATVNVAAGRAFTGVSLAIVVDATLLGLYLSS